MTTPRQPGGHDDSDDSNAVRYRDAQGWTPHRRPKPFSRQTPLPVVSPPWYRRPGIFIAAAALIVEVGITVSGPGDPGTPPGGATGTSTAWSASFSLITTGWLTPDPVAPPAAEAPPAEHQIAPPAAAPRTVPPPAMAPPPPLPSELVFRHEPLTAIVSITNNANKPAVGCVYRSVAVAGQATTIHYDHSVNFTVSGSAETRVHVGNGPATGSTFHVTVTCDNGLSTSQDVTY